MALAILLWIQANKNMTSELDRHPLTEKLSAVSETISVIKHLLYPDGVSTKKYYDVTIPSKPEFNELKTSIKRLKKHTDLLLKERGHVKKLNKVNAGTCLVHLKPDFAAFIGTEKLGTGDIYTNTLLTQYLTNYFYVNGLDRGVYVVPDDALKRLFAAELTEMGVIDERGGIRTRQTDKGASYKGFTFIHSQKLISKHIKIDAETGKRMKVETPIQSILDALERENTRMKSIHTCRKAKATAKVKVEEHEELRTKANRFDDKDAFETEHKALKRNLKQATEDLKSACKQQGFPNSL
jgi:hypothetical protein